MFYVQTLGSSSALPIPGRGVSSQVVTYNDKHYLIDCGEGTQTQMMRFKTKMHRIEALFISHLHGDHILGLPGLLSSFSLEGREKALKIHAPAAIKTLLDTVFQLTFSYLSYPIEIIPLEDFQVGQVLFSTDSLQVSLLPLKHRIYCRGFLFKEVNKKPKFNFYKAKALDIPNNYFHLLKLGNNITLEEGTFITADQVLDPPDLPQSFAYCSDTAYYPDLVPHIQGVNLLYHEATFANDQQQRAKETAHSTAEQAATIAQAAQVGQLLLGHFSARYKDLSVLWEEAKAIFPNTLLANDGEVYKVQ